jgi:hypothetical protein
MGDTMPMPMPMPNAASHATADAMAAELVRCRTCGWIVSRTVPHPCLGKMPRLPLIWPWRWAAPAIPPNELTVNAQEKAP